ncbi:hypothetical protein HYU14_01145 [Candidatus Woesearchaeota archaeon]|nr:hypothetical protein [Candidatus Woesearchaeota archaeon]
MVRKQKMKKRGAGIAIGVLALTLAVLLSSSVFAALPAGEPSHPTLYTDTIKQRASDKNKIDVDTNLNVAGQLSVNGGLAALPAGTAPATALRLDVNGAIRGTSLAVGSLTLGASSAISDFGSLGIFTTDASNNAYLSNPALKIGIGTTAPSEKVDIQNGKLRVGNLVVEDGKITRAAFGNIEIGDAANTQSIILTKPVGIGKTPAEGSALDVGGELRADSIKINGQTIQQMIPAAAQTWQLSAPPVNNLFYLLGKIGIGTGAPQRPLHISASQDANLRLQDISTDDSDHAAYVEFFDNTDQGRGYVGMPGGTSTAIELGTRQNRNIILQPGTGNVGVGESSPSAKLDVNGGIRIGDGGQGLKIIGSGTNAHNYQFVAGILSGLEGSLGIYDELRSAYRLVIDKDGKVGIGTTTPLSKLTVSQPSDSGKIEFLLGSNEASARAFIIRKDTTAPFETHLISAANPSADSGTLRFFTSDRAEGERMVITSAGDVGIGTTTPGAKLDVVGTIRATSFEGSGFIPSGAVMFFDLSTCPSGWTEFTDGRGRYIVGLPSGGTLKGTVGTTLTNIENRPVGKHTHGVTDPKHSHTIDKPPTRKDPDEGIIHGQAGKDNIGSGTFDTLASATGIIINNAGSVSGTNAPYIQLLVCKKD